MPAARSLLARDQPILGRRLRGHRIRRSRVRRRRHRERPSQAAGPRFPHIQAPVHQDAREPDLEGQVLAIRGDVGEHLDERVLHGLVRIVGVAQILVGNPDGAPLLAGEDVLTNMHANTTIPEVLGAARAWEVTGDDRWRAIVEAYWHSAVTARGYFATGGQTCGEIWTPPHEQAARLAEGSVRRNVGEHVAVLSQLVADCFCCFLRVVDRKNLATGSFH